MQSNKKILWIDGKPIEVTHEVYQAYTKGDRKMRYFEFDLKTEYRQYDHDGNCIKHMPSREDSLNRLIEEKGDHFAAGESLEDLIIQQASIENLRYALSLLTPDERNLIDALFFQNLSERAYAKKLGVWPNTIHKKKNRILKKLRKFLE